MKNCTLSHGNKNSAMTKISLKGGKILTLVVFFLSFTLGAMAQSGTPRSETMQVLASHYPVPSIDGCPFVKINWGMEMDLNYFDFEYGVLPDYWINDDTYPWVVTTPDSLSYAGYNGSFCMRSGNSRISNSTSSIEATVDFERNGSVSFLGGCWGEGSSDFIWDKCEFYIDDELKFSYGALQSWDYYSFEVSAGTHVFKWSYTKDSSADPTGDAFFVDDVTFDGVAGSRASSTAYNIYRRPCSASGGPIADEELIAEYVTSRQYIDSTWIDLEDGEYQYGVLNPWGTSGYTYWSNCLTKTELASVDITATASPVNGGTVSGGGNYNIGSICTLTARENDYYHFKGWMLDSIWVSYDTIYSFPVTKEANLSAIFAPADYYWWTTTEPYDGGEVEVEVITEEEDGIDEESDWTIHYGDSVILKAIPNEGYTFLKWSVIGNEGRSITELSTESEYSFKVDSDFLDRAFSHLEYEGYAIEFIATFIEGIGDCIRPSQLTCTDVSPDYATFSWTENGASTSWYIFYHDETPMPAYIPYDTIKVSQNPFTLRGLQPGTEYQAYVIPTCGVENGDPNSFLASTPIRFTTLGPCPSPLHVEVSNVTGTTATLTWLDYSDSYQVQVGIADTVYTEDFSAGIPYNWVNDTVYSWFVVDGHIQSGNAAIANSSSSISFTRSFNADGIVEFDAECRGEESGSSGGEDGEDDYEEESYIYDACTFYIDGEEQFSYGEAVVGWQHYSFNVPAGNHTFTWSYTKDISEDSPGDYFAIDNVMISEMMWNNPIPVVDSTYTITDLDPTTLYYVRVQGVCDTPTEWCEPIAFNTVEGQSCTITVNANPTNGGSVSGGGELNIGSTCTLSATANTGYTFQNWTLNDSVVSSSANYSFTVTGEATYVANFQLNSYTITVTANPEAGGTVNGGGAYNHGTNATLTATANEGYTFTGWADGVQDNPRTVTVTGTASYVANFQLNSYTITATANPEAGGTVNGGGTYNHGATVTLTATANEGYTFTGWADGVEDNPRTVTATGATSYVANFQLNSYTINVTANPTQGGTVTGGGTYNHGANATLTASDNTGYTFQNWTKNGTVVSTTRSFSITVTDTATYVANFQLNSYEISTVTDPTNIGTVTGGGFYDHGATATLTATPTEGYTFLNWTEESEVVSTDSIYSFQVIGARTLVAHFSLNSYQITATANPAEGGIVTGGGNYSYGSTATLNATANEGYTFTSWADGVQTNPRTVTVTGNASYVANFKLNSYTLTINYKYADGTNAAATHTESVNYNVDYSVTSPTITGYTPDLAVVTGTMGTQNVTVDVIYNINSYLLTINYKYDDGTPAATTHTESVNYNVDYSVTSPTITGYTPDLAVVTGTMGTQNVTVDVTYSVNSYNISTSANPAQGGYVTGGGTHNHFETVTLTAIANEGYTFIGWADGVQDNPRTITVTGPASYVANFQLNSYTISAYADPALGGTISGGGTYNHFETCTLTATVNEGYTFLNWTKNGTIVSTNPTYSFTVTEGAIYIANYNHISYQITATANPTEGGSIVGADTYYHGSACTLIATANNGYTFTNWTKNGTVVSTNPTYSFIVTESANYVANFTLNIYVITVTANPTAGGSVFGGSAYLFGENCTVIASPNAGYTFINWTKDNVVVSTDVTYTFTVTQNTNLVANFSLDHYNITVSADPEEGGTVTGGGNFTYGETCTLTAAANAGYSFINWTKNGTVVSNNANYSFTVTDNGSFVANFDIAHHTITALAEPADGGSISGGGTYQYGSIATLRANANEGYVFVNWTKNGTTVSTNPVYSTVVREDAEYVANFRHIVYEIKAKTDPEHMGDIAGTGFYNYGETCTLTVTPHSGYEFVNWTLDGQVVSEDESFSFVVTEAHYFVANLQYVEGIDEQGNIMVSLFPNPAKTKLTIEASEPINTLEIYSINGALIYKRSNCSDKIEINVGSYANGTYMIRLTTDSTVEIRRFVKE